MVEAEIDVMKRAVILMLLLLASSFLYAQEYSWKSVRMDGSRTGTALGTMTGGRYVTTDGKVFPKNSCVSSVARIVMDAQPEMARVKEVIAYSPEAMEIVYPEGPLSNWFIGILMQKVSELSGRHVDIGISNFGGIRVDMPKGDVILDDMLSMFPFKNQLVYVELKGSVVRSILDAMAADRFQVLGGVRVVAEDGKIVSATIGDEPLDDDKVYGVATISFLLHGGDNLSLAEGADTVVKYDVDIIDAVLEHVRAETASGRQIVSKADGRVVIR